MRDMRRLVQELALEAVFASRRTQHLRGLEQQFVDVLVAVIPRGEARVLVEPEDVHGPVGCWDGLSMSSQY